MIGLKLREVRKDLSSKELRVADYIIENTSILKNMSIQTLAQVNHISTTTILRLCRKLGYSGFSELKIDVIASVKTNHNNEEFLQEDINLNDSLLDVMNKVQQMEKSAIDETYAILNMASLSQAIDMIIDSQKIIIYGAGGSGLVGKELEYQLYKIKKDVSCHLDHHVQYSIVNILDPHDLVIIISHLGETPECVKLLQFAKERNVPSIAITKMGQSRVSALASVVLHTSSSEHVSRIIPIRSKISQLSVINILVTNIFIKQYDERLYSQIQNRAERMYRNR